MAANFLVSKGILPTCADSRHWGCLGVHAGCGSWEQRNVLITDDLFLLKCLTRRQMPAATCS